MIRSGVGQEIVYCFKCQTRLLAADFDKGRAVRHGNHVACSDCAPELLRSLSPAELKEVFEKPERRPAAQPRPASTRRMGPVPSRSASPPSRSALLLVAAAVAAVVLIGFLATVLGKPAAPAPLPPPPAAAPQRAAAPPPPPKTTPDPLETTRIYLRKLAEIDGRARPLIAAEKFGEASALYESARSRHEGPEWVALLDGKTAEIRREAQRLLSGLQSSAAEARRGGRPQEALDLRARVAGWGLPSALTDFDAFLATVPEERPWRELFDGRTLGFLVPEAHSGWRVEDGLMVKSSVDNAAQTVDRFGDGEFRFRFDGSDLFRFDVYFRAKTPGTFAVNVPRDMLQALDASVHEMIVRMAGTNVTAMLDGNSVSVTVQGSPGPEGRIQFNGRGKLLRYHSIAFRPTP